MTFFYINATLVFARIFFPSSKTFFLYTQKTHFSQILSTNLSKSLCPLNDVGLQSGGDPDEHPDELPSDGFSQLVHKFFGPTNQVLQQLSGWLLSDDHRGEHGGCGGPGLALLYAAGWMHCQIL